MVTGLKRKNGRVPSQGSGRARSRTRVSQDEDDDLQRLLVGLQRLHDGDFSVRLRLREGRRAQQIARIFNSLARHNQRLTREFGRVANLVGRQGRIAERTSLKGMQGAWATMIEAQNSAVDDLVHTILEISRVIRAVANGDLSQSVPFDVAGRATDRSRPGVPRTTARAGPQPYGGPADAGRKRRG